MIGYIYKTTNLVNKKIYVGQRSGNFETSYLGSGMLIKRAINKYDRNSFKVEFIVCAKSKEQLDKLEKKYIAYYRRIFGRNKLYNLADGGRGSLGWKPTKKQLEKMSISHSGVRNAMYGVHPVGELNPMYGKKHSDKTRKLISKKTKLYPNFGKWNKGLIRSRDFRKQESETKKRLLAEGKLIPAMKGKHLSNKAKNKIKIAMKRFYSTHPNPFLGKKHTKETKRKMREAR